MYTVSIYIFIYGKYLDLNVLGFMRLMIKGYYKGTHI